MTDPALVRPSPRQLRWQALEFYAFVHFGMNTVTDREWGLGHEDPALFDPADVDAAAWVEVFADAGMRGVVLTAKHHDGFCLWPSAVTNHSVASSPWRRDLVREVSDACAAAGLEFGVYLSPWDRTDARYGSGSAYDDFFVAQLTELLTGYGEVFSVWLDGANGEGPDGRRQFYDWDRYHRVVRELQPSAVISVCGPDVRWCGNEAGHTRADEWSVVPAALREAEFVASRSQQADDGAFSRLVRSDAEDLGSREALAGDDGDLVWYPAEVNTSIRPGWFHHPAEDSAVRSAQELFDLWRAAVGGNSCFLLNVPPAASGRLGAPDVAALRGLGALIRSYRSAERLPCGGVLPEPVVCRAVELREDIAHGQLVEEFTVTLFLRGELVWRGSAGVVGSLRILQVPDVVTDRAEVLVVRSRGPVRLESVVVAGSVDGQVRSDPSQ
jgi:alpha-L-fucosidase